MICSNCGAHVNDGSKYCQVCGNPVINQADANMGGQQMGQPMNQQMGQPVNQQMGQPVNQQMGQPVNQQMGQPVNQQMGQPMNQQMGQPVGQKQLGLGWANFLGYFALWLGAVVNLYNSMALLFGFQYLLQGISAEEVYSVFGTGLMVVDKIYGVCVLGMVVLGVMTAIAIIKRKQNAGKLLMILYIVQLVTSLLYTVAVMIFTHQFNMFFNLIPQLIVPVIMLIVNNIYFNNRKHIFVN